MWPMVSKFAGRCKTCGGRIRMGDNIIWSKGTGAMHPECAPQQQEEDGGVVCTFCGEPAEDGDTHEDGDKVWCVKCWCWEEGRGGQWQ